jgi:prephenate dehydratase
MKKIAYLGPNGTFTHRAAVAFFGLEEEFISRNTVKDVLHLYKIRAVTNCVLAIESSIVGTVRENLDEMLKIDQGFVVGEVFIPVHHHLMAKPGANLHGVKVVIGHAVAIEESNRWLQQNLPNVKLETVPSSSMAPLEVSRKRSLTIAAIASKTAAELYKLKILASDIEDIHDNVTRFWVLGRKIQSPTGQDKTAFLVQEDINAVLHGLIALNISVISIYERPATEGSVRHFYFMEAAGHAEEYPLDLFLKKFPKIRLLGSYPRKHSCRDLGRTVLTKKGRPIGGVVPSPKL